MDALASNVAAGIALLGVLLGAALQHYFTRTAQKREQFDTLRIQSYVDYLNAVAMFAQANATNQDRFNHLAGAANAKTRICIYGSEEIIKLLANFERKGANLANSESADIFIQIIAQMRIEGIGSVSRVSLDDLEAVILGPRG